MVTELEEGGSSSSCTKITMDLEYDGISYATSLPLEVVIHFMEFLNYADRVAASQVCVQWYEAAQHPKFLQREKVVIKKCSSEAISVFKRASKPYLHFVILDVELSNKVKEFWAKVGPDLRSLYFGNCVIYERMLLEILSGCFNLESLGLDNCRELFMPGRLFDVPEDAKALCKALVNVRELSVNSNRYLSDALVNRLINVLPNMSSISMEKCQMSFHAGLVKKYYPNSITAENADFASETVLTFKNFYNMLLKRANMIKKINLSMTLIDSSALCNISEINNLQLEELHLTRCEQLNNAGVISLAQHQKSLTVLDVSYCSRITDQGLLHICSNLHNIQKLSFRNCRAVSDLGVAQIKKLIYLEELDFSQCELVTGASILEGLCSSTNKRLKKLVMEGLNTISSSTVVSLAESLPELTHLNLSYCFHAVTDSAVQAIFEHQKRLRSLKLASCDALTDAGLTGMGSAVSVDNDNFIRQPTEHLNDDTSIPQRMHISLRSKAEEEIIQDAFRKKAVQQMCEDQLHKNFSVGYSLNQLKGLHELDLRSCNKITDVTLKYALRFLELQHLNLSKCQQITHVGLQAVGENNPSIDTLNLSQCYNITDEGLTSLTKNLHRLKYLDIKGCTQLTGASVTAIADNCHQLRYLDASYCNNMADKITEMQHRLPMQLFFTRSDPTILPPTPPPLFLR